MSPTPSVNYPLIYRLVIAFACLILLVCIVGVGYIVLGVQLPKGNAGGTASPEVTIKGALDQYTNQTLKN